MRPDRYRISSQETPPPKPLFGRVSVVLPLFLLCLSVLIGGYYWQKDDPAKIYAQAEPLIHSEDPADWEKAWQEYLEPLSRKHPDVYVEEVKKLRQRVEPLVELRRATATGKAVRYTCEAERLYQAGMRLCQAGDFAGAKALWLRLVVVFGADSDQKHWVELSQQAATRTTNNEGVLHRPNGLASVQTVLARAKQLEREGKPQEARQLRESLAVLYRDDPDAQEIHNLLKQSD